jgi:hypothetical protein
MDLNNKPVDGYGNCYGNGTDFWRDNAVSYGIDEAAIICGRYIDGWLGHEQSDDERQFCREIFAAMYEATAGTIVPAKLVYPYDFKTANDRMETAYYHKNRDMNVSCAGAIDAAISASSYKTHHANLELAPCRLSVVMDSRV